MPSDKANDAINKGKSQESRDIDEQATQATEAYKKLSKTILSIGRAAEKQHLADLNKYLADEASAYSTEAYTQKQKERNDLVRQIRDEDLQRVEQFAQTIGQLGQSFVDASGDAAQFGQLLVG